MSPTCLSVSASIKIKSWPLVLDSFFTFSRSVFFCSNAFIEGFFRKLLTSLWNFPKVPYESAARAFLCLNVGSMSITGELSFELFKSIITTCLFLYCFEISITSFSFKLTFFMAFMNFINPL